MCNQEGNHLMVRKSRGFTLIELMIVVAIVGILASFALPIYQGYVVKTQLNRAVGEVAAYKSAFEERVSRSGSVSNADLGYVPSDITNGALGVDIAMSNPDGSGHMEVTLGGGAHALIQGVIVRFERSATGAWSCTIDKTSAPLWSSDFRPSNCTVI